MKLKINIGILLRFCAIFLVLFLGWYFSGLALYIFLAFIFSLMGKPIAKNINRIKIYKYRIPYGICSLLTLIVFIMFFVLILIFIFPMLTKETQRFANINYDELSRNLSYMLDNLENFLHSNNLIDRNKTLVGLVTEEIMNFANLTNFSNILGGLMCATGSFLM